MNKTLFSRTRLISILTLILVLGFALISLTSYNITKNALNEKARNQILPLISDNIYSEIQQTLIKPINNSSLMAHDEFLINWVKAGEKDTQEIVRYLNRIKEEYDYASAFFVSQETGNYYYYDGILKQISPEDEHDAWYYRFVALNTAYDLDVDMDEADQGKMTVFINHRLEDHAGYFLGVVGVGLEMDSIGKTLESYKERFGHTIYMIDDEGVVQVHPDAALIETVNIKDLVGINEISEDILSRKEGTHIYEFTNQQGRVVISTRYFPDFGWFLIVEQNMSESHLAARKQISASISVEIFLTFFVILLVVLTVNAFHKRLEKLATIDELTGLYNRGQFAECFQREVSRAKRYEQVLSLLLIDIDRFKEVNDHYGHQVGDAMLKKIAEVMQNEIREIDIIARWGGEEFVILLHNMDEQGAYLVAERLRLAVATVEIKLPEGIVQSTISIGICSASSGEMDMDEMIREADQAMYEAKRAGRNQARQAH